MRTENNIAIVWDFDKILTPQDSTTEVVEFLLGKGKSKEFWNEVKNIGKLSKKLDWEHILASDAPTWMYTLAREAFIKKAPLNSEFFREFIVPNIRLYNNAEKFLIKLKNLSNTKKYKNAGLKIHHFVVSAGLKDLIEQVFPENLVTWVFGCRYQVIANKGFEEEPESIPVFCMDDTMKTRSLFEISKGTFKTSPKDREKSVNDRVSKEERFVPFENIIYIGDSDTDIPALSLTRKNGGVGIIVDNLNISAEARIKRNETLAKLKRDKRADLITAADFSLDGELFKYISARCKQIRQRYEAEKIS